MLFLDMVSSGGLSRLPGSRHLGTFGTLFGPLPKLRLYLSSDLPQNLTVLSSLPLASDLASGLHVTVLTSLKAFSQSVYTKTKKIHCEWLWETYSECPGRFDTHWPVTLDRLVYDSTGYCTVGTPCHRVDPVFTMRWVSTRRNSDKRRTLDEGKKISPIWVSAQGRPEFCLCFRIKELNKIEVVICDLGAVRGKCQARDLIVDGQRRLSRSSRRLPYLYGWVPASTSNLFVVWTEGNTRNITVKCSIVSTQHVW
jgi:hypothetical protein